MIFSREKRIKYLGFDDFWFVVVGVLILSFFINYIFNNSFGKLQFLDALVNWGISIFFCIINWVILRWITIALRKKFPDFKDNLKRIAIVFLIIIFTIVAIDYIGTKILSAIFGDSYNPIERSKILAMVLVLSTMVTAIYEAIYLYKQLRRTIREEEQAKQVIVQAELDALRNQAQPHFLFNSLNTLRDIIDQNPKEDAKEFVDKLSNVYRFILESGSSHLTTLRNELKFSKSYTHIQKERFGDNLRVTWDIPEELLEKLVTPMSVQLLLENAIKHNIISKSKPLTINIHARDHQIIIENNIQLKTTKLPSTKLGLKNIEKRYHLISDRSISISEKEGRFIVHIPLLHPSDLKENHAITDY